MKKQLQLFKRYYKRIALHGILKSLLISLIVAFSCFIVMSFFFWLFGVKAIWICFTTLGGLILIVTPIIYFIFYRPDTTEIARRIDETGLEERMITMTELDGDDSFIARMQREDAIKALKSVDAKLIKFAVSIPFIVSLCTISVLGVGATVFDVLYKENIVKPGTDIIDNIKPDDTISYEINYIAGEGGYIDGEAFQVVDAGNDSELVIAEADDGYVFVCWTDADGNELGDDSSRIETNVSTDLTFYAQFQMPDDSNEDGDGDGDGEGEDSSDSDAQNQPSDSNNSSDSPNDSNGQGKGDGAGGSNDDSNRKVYDGQQDYGGENYNNGKNDSDNELNQNGSISKNGSDVAAGYFDTIKN